MCEKESKHSLLNLCSDVCTLAARYWGNNNVWGRGTGSGPWVMADLENGE